MPGGSANRYDYSSQDPINNRDLQGTEEATMDGGFSRGAAGDGGDPGTIPQGGGRPRPISQSEVPKGDLARGRKVVNQQFRTKSDARRAADWDRRNLRRARFRNADSGGDHYRVDLYTSRGKRAITIHYYWQKYY